IPQVQIPSFAQQHSILAPLLNPPIAIVNAMVVAILALLNVLIGFGLTIVIRGVAIGVELGKLLWQLLFEANAALQLMRVLLSMAITFMVIVTAVEAIPDLW